jgi:hypothetical protein
MSRLHIEENYVRFEVFTAVAMKNVVFRDVTQSGLISTDDSEESSSETSVLT